MADHEFRSVICKSPFPWLRPNWREECASWPLEHQRAWQVATDRFIRRLCVYHQLRQADNWEEELRQYKGLRDVHAAVEIHREPFTDRLLRAAIIAGRTPEEVQVDFLVPPAVLETYEKIFFDVRDYLKAQGAIITYLYFCDKEFRLIGHLAYDMGWEVVQSFESVGPMSEEVTQKLKEVISAKVMRDAFEAVHLLRVNRGNAAQILKRHVEWLKVEKGTKAAAARGGVRRADLEKVGDDMARWMAESRKDDKLNGDQEQSSKTAPIVDLKTDELTNIKADESNGALRWGAKSAAGM